jgi:ribosomal-protein-alanine N-acetyltransferase
MKIFKETDRLILREITINDVDGFWQLDSDPHVLRYLGNKPVTNIDQCKAMVEYIQQQYIENGIGRWAMIEKRTGRFIGWTGIKYIKEEINGHSGYYDLGYRLIKEFWGQGFATEGSIASLDYAFEDLKLKEIYAIADSRNKESINVLNKLGFLFEEKFTFNNAEHSWLSLSGVKWMKRKPNKV